jgi:putative membrane protein
MGEDDIKVPVFLVTGFLESGKTTFLNDTLRQDYFRMDETTLLINCEEGEVEYDEKELKKLHTELVQVEDEEQFTPEFLKELDKKYQPARVMLEYNPLWSVAKLEEMELPEGWGILQEIVTIDSSTFQVYLNNMKSLFMEMTKNAELVIINRADPKSQPLANFRRSIKVTNPGCQILFEDTSGNMTDIFEDSVPYDLDADPIVIDDVDFGIFFVDLRDNPDRYKGKKVRFKGRVLKSRHENANFFVPGRQAMTCCAEDTQFIGYICESTFAPKLKTGQWVEVTADVDWKFEEAYGEEGPVFLARAVKSTKAPDVDLVYFT